MTIKVKARGNRGVAILMILATVSMAMGVLAGTFALVGVTSSQMASRMAERVLERVQAAWAFAEGASILSEQMAKHGLALMTAGELSDLDPSGRWRVEDEGGKIPLPSLLPMVPAVLYKLGLADWAYAQNQGRHLAQAWNVPVIKPDAESPAFPMPFPSPTPVGRARLESVGELAALLGVPASDLSALRQAFTPFGLGGLNVRTAPLNVLAGAMFWQAQTSALYQAPVVEGLVPGPPGQTVHMERAPTPMPDPVLVFQSTSPTEPPATPPPGLLNFTIPPDLWGLSRAYEPHWAFARAHPINSPAKDGFRAWGGLIQMNVFWRNRYTLPTVPWVRAEAVRTPEDFQVLAQAGAPLSLMDLTQPLALAWITPDAWFMPLAPVAGVELHDAGDQIATQQDAALSAAAFSGWFSLQGAGPYRSGSEVYGIVQAGKLGTSRIVVRPFVRGFPQILSFEEEG